MKFSTQKLAEHHFSSYGIFPSLAPFAAATRRVRIGTAVVIAPFEHPLHVRSMRRFAEKVIPRVA
jgi:alkanesulfonate monooxygenase SsuD/methylene tetrahydromethanopterin reductase-like flavin-dependent oxidoreductase (luciferase family)